MSDPEKEEPKKLEWPIEHRTCPVCGSTRRISEEVRLEEVAKGKIHTTKNSALGQFAVTIADQSKLVGGLVNAPTLITYIDACAEPGCGVVYVVHSSKTDFGVMLNKNLPTMPAGRNS